ncbi:MAG TPA: LytTR family DNA-binding domain-containing protein, partial [Gemmatimonadaceae bacterium]|nr:LytTR family DNA-binding domain-containing protein [Gemmatimonadaceae bacterium]
VTGHPDLALAGEAADGREALDTIVEVKPDLVFLDIQMPELDGFQVVAALDDDAFPALVFVTAYDAFAIKAFEVDAIDYLLKPVTAERFAAAVERVKARLGRKGADDPSIRTMLTKVDERRGPATRFVARRGQKHYFVRVADIDWVEAEGNYLRLVTGDTSHLIRETMKGIESRLDPSQFVRVHRSAIVAIDRIRSIEAREHGEYVITMSSGAKLESSRGYSDRVRSLLR